MRASIIPALALLALGMAARVQALEPNAMLVAQVRAAETAFARSMADRDLKAFSGFVADDAVFIGTRQVLRGRESVTAGWKAFFDGPTAPFSWQPEQVEVVASGTLALSSGPVLDPQGQRIGTFKSTWRRDRDGRWRVVLDSGCPACNCPPAANGTGGQ
jgi:uncharacterized protein (TIGR02246 family)